LEFRAKMLPVETIYMSHSEPVVCNKNYDQNTRAA